MEQNNKFLDNRYSTTRMLYKADDGERPSGPCNGLRKKGFLKRSYPQKPLISVIIVVLNRSETIEFSILSVIHQLYDNIELIVIDGGSTDGTLDLIQSYDHCIDYWISEPDGGVYQAMNKGADQSRGDWIYFLGSDDVLTYCLHKVAKHLIDSTTVYYGDVYLPTSHKLAYGEYDQYKLMLNNIPHQATFYPRYVFENYQFNTKYFSSADYDLNLRCFCDNRLNYTYIPVLVAIYEDTSGLSTLKLDKGFEEDFQSILKQNFPRFKYYEYCVRMFLKNFERLYVRKAIRYLRGKR